MGSSSQPTNVQEAGLRGVTTALVTPMLDGHEVDFDGLRENVRAQVASGVRNLLPLGTTGEAPTLDATERAEVLRVVVEEAKAVDGVGVMAGVGSNSTSTTIDLAEQARAAGVDSLLVVAPYYNKPTPDGLVAHFHAVGDSTDLPIVVYNVPGRTSVNISPEVLGRIAEHPGVVAVKEASGDIMAMMQILANLPDLVVLSGDDALTFPLLCLGGHGVVSVVSNLLPELVVDMVDSAMSGRIEEARRLHFELLPIFRTAFVESNPGPIKYAMTRSGLAAGPTRLPLVEMRAEHRDLMDTVLLEYGLGTTGFGSLA